MCAVPCAKEESLKGKWISLGFLEAPIISDYKNPKPWGKGVTCSACPCILHVGHTVVVLSLHFTLPQCSSARQGAHSYFHTQIFQWKIHLRSVFKQTLMKIQDARKSKDMLSRIFGILESLDQHNLNKFFVGKMRDLAGICFLCCVLCFTEKLCYEGGMLHFPIRGFQSLSVLEVPLMACFSKLPLHLLPVFNRSLLPFLGIF